MNTDPVRWLDVCLRELDATGRGPVLAIDALRQAMRAQMSVWALADVVGDKPHIHDQGVFGFGHDYLRLWEKVSGYDKFFANMKRFPGQVQHFTPTDNVRDSRAIVAFATCHGLHSGIGIALPWERNGRFLYLMLYRDHDWSESARTCFSILARHVAALWSPAASDSRERPIGPLRASEWKVAQLFTVGYSHREVAERLGLSPATVRTYLQRSYSKLGVRNKVELARRIAESRSGPVFGADEATER